MDVKNMTAEERAQLKAQLAEEDRQEALRKQEQKDAYMQMKDQFLERNLEKLKALSDQMQALKKEIFDDAETLIKLKDELFHTKTDRQSNMFTHESGKFSITLGNRINEGWDDTCEQGIEKVKEFLHTLAKDDNSAALVETIMRLIAKNNKGMLKASKVLELEKLASKIQSAELTEGLNIIKNSYRPKPTCQFISVTMKDDNGNDKQLPLSLSQC